MSPDPAIETTRQVLVVDDDRFFREFVRRLLEREGHDVVLAEDAEAALRQMKDATFDLVVTDVLMPGRSGLDLLVELKEHFPLLPVIIVTGKPRVEAAVNCIRTGAFDYLTKPLDPRRFLDHVQVALSLGDEVEEIAEPEEQGEHLLSRWRRVAGYELVKVVGEGGIGIVFLAEKEDEDGVVRRYALKVLKPELLNQDTMRESLTRFMREAKLAKQIDHPNVIRIHEYGLARNEQIPYIVMDYIQGHPLSYFIQNGDLLGYEEKALVLRQAASALAAVHAAHMFHRDIKPDNLIVSEDLRVTLADFGIATSLGAHRLTQIGCVIGSPAYMSPELYAQKNGDARSDIFSLGAVAYELLLGVPPFDADTLEELSTRVRTEAPMDPLSLDPQMPERLAGIVRKMLAKEPDDRYQSARGLVAALDEYLQPDSLLKSLMRRLGR